MNSFGRHLRAVREARLKEDRRFSVRRVAGRVGIEPSYLSKVERGQQPPPGEETVRKLAVELGEDADVLLALGGKVSGDLLKIIRNRPRLFSQLIRQLKDLPDNAIVRLVREVRDGDW